MNILDNLNDEQKKAASYITGPTLILAGAGSGKTRTITYKIAHMVKECNIPSHSILALTFTNKAALEMKERISSLIGNDAKQMIISTFHSFAIRILRQYGTNIGFTNNFNIYDADDSKKLIKKIIKNSKLNIDKTASDYYSKISRCKENGICLKTFDKEMNLKINDNRIFYEIYKEYQETLINNNCMDFTDILINCKKLLMIPEILAILQERYKYILVDEYQDTNDIQYNIVKLLAQKYRNICVVGDEDQSIYAFRGANINNILNFEKDYPEAKIIKLEQNYRSTSNILNLANSVISKNTSSLGKALWTKNGLGKKPTIYEACDPYDEAQYICNKIKSSSKKRSDFAILYRRNAQSRILEQVLNKNGIYCTIYGGLSFYQRKEVKDLLAYLLFLNNPNDSISFDRCISNPKRNIGDKTKEKILNIAKENNISLLEALGKDTNNRVNSFYNLITTLAEDVDTLTVSALLQKLIEKIDYFEYISKLENAEDRKQNVLELLTYTHDLEKMTENLSLDEFLTLTSLSSSNDNVSTDDKVKLMTIHSSKGLEFDTIFLAGFESDLFPTYTSILEPSELEEERRLLYVAITRAQQELYFTYCLSRSLNGITEYNKTISAFSRDMNESYYEYENKFIKPNEIKKQTTSIENFNPFKFTPNTKFKIGQVVKHNSYGTGRIKNIDDKGLVIEFAIGDKKISLALADKFLK
ncbi:ATP-dependent helicase [Sneathia sanguinegens]|uniref:ATP-dependent helicase n=1 Tax=Sneathia sanguinegens TaxID=40543 RepID=UPI0023F8D464|nr:UvrD-helicase domain-containing protein [Sneathia sanguinegens]